MFRTIISCHVIYWVITYGYFSLASVKFLLFYLSVEEKFTMFEISSVSDDISYCIYQVILSILLPLSFYIHSSS